MSHARMKTVFLHFSNYLPWSIFLLLQLLVNLVFMEFLGLFLYQTRDSIVYGAHTKKINKLIKTKYSTRRRTREAVSYTFIPVR